jgi:4-amino-4-deoxy-L-arabinose transferase-like glycosyltransferase
VQNAQGARFCSECGADLRALGSKWSPPAAPPGPTVPTFGAPNPPPVDFGPGGWQVPGQNPYGTPPPKKRTWLWIILGILGACLVLCCIFAIWGSTSGSDTFSRWATDINEWSTEVSAE